jgi:hypothetical protein
MGKELMGEIAVHDSFLGERDPSMPRQTYYYCYLIIIYDYYLLLGFFDRF